jgi:hypothetical protein
MAVIIPFKARQRQDAAERASTGPCAILLFTGVRYERHDDARPADPAPTVSPRGATRRAKRRA